MAQLAIELDGRQAISEAVSLPSARRYIARGSMAERDKIPAFRRRAVAGWLALVAALVPGTSAAAAQTILQVEASSGLPGLHRGELQRYLVLHMAEVGSAIGVSSRLQKAPPHVIALNGRLNSTPMREEKCAASRTP
jgi:hypothetical protein